jgi:eukaryotic-like serine/threonine-protein kinase
MQNIEWIKIKEVFNQAIDLPTDKRESFLVNFDDALQKEVRELIKSHEESEKFIAEPAAIELGFSNDLIVGTTIDSYKIVAPIGVGGMGAVYLAERIDLGQKVAIKLIKRGMDTNAVLKRFKMERQILSRLNHPNIAGLLDAGSTEDGLPYFVMEYIEGETIIKFCDSHHFDINERLELFQKVCSAISYAHSNLIVHRDIKPSNIIVTADGTPKLLDFGIAKLLDNETENTATQARIFTPEYASPEQINGLPITTATDVYSLGVVLYQLLSGVRPFTSESRNYAEIANLVLTVEPIRPSYAWRDAETQRKGDTEKERHGDTEKNQSLTASPRRRVSASISPDLDNIVLKSLRKEPERRYQSVSDFSEDIKRHLQGLPVTATADSTRYRFTKFVQRHKRGVAIGSIVGLLILAISGVAIWQAIVANRERAKAERRLVETRKIANSLMFEIHDSLQELPGAIKSRELLVTRALEYLDGLYKESDENPELLKELSIAYRKVADIQGEPYRANLGQSEAALENYLKAYEIQNKLYNLDSQDLNLQDQISQTTHSLGRIYQIVVFDFKKAFNFFRISQKHLENICLKNPNDANSKSQLAIVYNLTSGILSEQGDMEGSIKDRELAVKFNDDALTIDPESEFILSNGASLFSQIGNELGNPDYNDSGEPEKALPLLQKALSLREKQFNKDSTSITNYSNIAVSYRDLAEVYLAQKELPKAVESLQKALSIHEELALKDNDGMLTQANVAFSSYKLGTALMQSGRLDESLKLNQKSVAIYERLSNSDPDSVAVKYTLGLSLEKLADTLFAKKDIVSALKNYERSFDLINKSMTDETATELVIAKSRVSLKLGKTRQSLNQNCNSYFLDFENSVSGLEKVKLDDNLSPTNNEYYMEAKKLVESSNCR